MAVHLPMGLLLGSLAWDALALASGEPSWWTLSYFTIALGLVTSVPTALTGFIDYAAALAREDAQIAAVATSHMMFAVSATALFLVSLLLREPSPGASAAVPWGALVAAWLGAVLLGVAGRQGGRLILEHGLGRARPDEARRDSSQEVL